MKTYEFHPAADIYPLMEGDEFSRMVEDIAEHGVKVPVQLCTHERKKKIIDGRNRYRAADEAGVNMPTVDVTDIVGGDGVAHVISLNEVRRHLTASQRAVAADAVLALSQKEKGKAKPDPTRGNSVSNNGVDEAESQETVAKKFGISRASVSHASKVREKGAKSVKDAVKAGKLSVYAASQLVDQVDDKTNQATIVAAAIKEAGTGTKETTTGVERAVSKVVNTKVAAKKPKPKGPCYAERVLGRMDDNLAWAWGIEEKSGSVAKFLDSKPWNEPESIDRKGEYVAKIAALAEEYAKLHKQCEAYARKHKLYDN